MSRQGPRPAYISYQHYFNSWLKLEHRACCHRAEALFVCCIALLVWGIAEKPYFCRSKSHT